MMWEGRVNHSTKLLLLDEELVVDLPASDLLPLREPDVDDEGIARTCSSCDR